MGMKIFSKLSCYDKKGLRGVQIMKTPRESSKTPPRIDECPFLRKV